MVTNYFNILARQRQHEAIKAEAAAKARAARIAAVRAEMANGPKVIWIDSAIGTDEGELSSAWLRSQLPTDNREIVVKIHSEGGSCIEAFGMFDALADYAGPKRCEVASMAFSAASLLPCCFDDSSITPNAFTMIHSPRFDSDEITNSQQSWLDDLHERMVAIYATRTGKPESVIRRLVDNESFFDAEDSVALGLVHRVAGRNVVAKKLPGRIVAKLKPSTSATGRWRAAVDANGGNIMKADKENPGLRLKMLAEVNRR